MENPVNSFLQIKQQDIEGLKIINEPLFDAIMDALAAIQVYSTENSVNMSVEDVENVLSPKKPEIAEAIVELPEQQVQEEPKPEEIKQDEPKDTQGTEQVTPEEIGVEKLVPVSAYNGFELGKKYRFKTLDELKAAGVKSAKGREYLLGKEIVFDPKDLDWLNNRFRKVYYLDTKKYFNLDNPNGDNEWSLSFEWVLEVVPASKSIQSADEDEDELSPVEQFKHQKSQSDPAKTTPKKGKITVKKSKLNRPSPSESAAATPIGTKMKGNDGNMYIVRQNKAGVKQWKLYKK